MNDRIDGGDTKGGSGEESGHPEQSDVGEAGVTAALVAEAVTLLEEQADRLGWDNPAVLWQVDMPTVDDVAPELLTDSLVGMALHFIPLAEFTCHPCEVLSGLVIEGGNCVGAALVTEAWAAPENENSAGELLLQPSQHPDRFDLRLAMLVLRDGTTVTASRPRGGRATLHVSGSGHSIEGSVVQHLRRAIGLPSRVGEPTVPLAQMQRRLKAFCCLVVINGLLEHYGVVDGSGMTKLPKSMDEQLSGDQTLESTVVDLVTGWGFDQETWDAALNRARELDVPSFLGTGEQLRWWDGILWSDWLDDRIPTIEDVAEQLTFNRDVAPRLVEFFLRLINGSSSTDGEV